MTLLDSHCKILKPIKLFPYSPKFEVTTNSLEPTQPRLSHHASFDSESEEELWDLGWLFRVLRRKSLLILGLAVSTTLAAGLLVILSDARAKPSYGGNFQLLVEPATAEGKIARSFLQNQSSERAALEGLTNFDQVSTLDYETQIRILKSRKLLLPVVEQIQLRYPDTTYEVLTENLKIERIKLTKDGKELGTKLLEITYTATDSNQTIFVLEQISQAYLRYSLKERQSNIRQGIKFIDQQLPSLRERSNALEARIETLRRQNNLMDPEREGIEFSTLLTSLKHQQLEILAKFAESQGRYKALQEQLSGNNAIAVLSEFPTFQKLLDQYQDLESQRATTSARFGEESPPMQALLRKQKNLQDVLNQEAARILTRSAANVETLQTQQRALSQAEDSLNQQFQRLPAVARQYANLRQELKIASETLDRYLSKNEELRIDAAQQEAPWELIAAPTLTVDSKGSPVNLNSKNKKLLLAISAVLAILLAVGIAFLIEVLQDILYTPNEVKRLSKLPVLGTIPDLGTADSLISGLFRWVQFSRSTTVFPRNLAESEWQSAFPTQPPTLPLQPLTKAIAFSEAFNVLFSNIFFSRGEANIQSLAISSPSPQEGKSTISIYLAKAAVKAGKKVLLVDGDLRTPRLHTYFGLDNSKGLSDLIESELDIQEVIQSSLWEANVLSLAEDNLFVLTAGRVLSDQIGLLSSKKLKILMQQFVKDFDLVIYDTPPLLDFADLSWISSQVDSFVMVINLGKTKRTALAQAIESLKNSHIPLLGIVANGHASV